MEVKFDSNAAQSLIKSIDGYCTSIQKDAIDTLNITKSINDWNDPQFRSFCESIDRLFEDLEKNLQLESEYLRIFQSRVNELRG